MGFKEDRHTIGFAGPEASVRDGYRPELDGLAQAKFDVEVEKEATTATKSGLARLRRMLRRLFWEF